MNFLPASATVATITKPAGRTNSRDDLTSAFDGQRKAGMDPIKISAKDILDATPFHKCLLLGGVLSEETDRMFLERKRY
jgi:hypothetical protein